MDSRSRALDSTRRGYSHGGFQRSPDIASASKCSPEIQWGVHRHDNGSPRDPDVAGANHVTQLGVATDAVHRAAERSGEAKKDEPQHSVKA
jgi:hypothetical protein